MEETRRTRAAVAITIALMFVAAGLVGYGLGYQHGVWNSSPSFVGNPDAG